MGRNKLPEDLTAQYLSHSGGTNLATGQRGRGLSYQGGPIKQEPLPPTPAQVKKDQSDADRVAPDARRKIRQAPANARTGALALSAGADQILENPKDKNAIREAKTGVEQTRTFLDNVRGRKGVVKDVKKKLDNYADALQAVEKGRMGAKKRLEKAKNELGRSGRKLN